MKSIFFSLLLLVGFTALAQDPHRFENEVHNLSKRYDSIWNPSEKTIVFTGSSSIRKWVDLPQRFPQQQVLNTGFGGSQASDLLYYINDLVLKYKPSKVFVYEGDNDIADHKQSKEIMANLDKIVTSIKTVLPETQIVLLSVKPSISRWKLKGKYKKLNRKMARYTTKDPLVQFCDVWTPMLDENTLKQDIFVSDDLHMNAKGYEIWYNVIKDYMAP